MYEVDELELYSHILFHEKCDSIMLSFVLKQFKFYSILCSICCWVYTSNAQINSSIKLSNPFGIEFTVSGNPATVVVETIAPNSPAASTEIQVGDIIISMNGILIEQNLIGLEKLRLALQRESLMNATFDVERREPQKHTKRVSYILERKIPIVTKKPRVYGIGVTLILDTLKLNSSQRIGAVVDTVYNGSPAESAGILKGDFIIEVDGHLMNEKTLDLTKEVVDWLLIDEPKIAEIIILRRENQIYTTKPMSVQRADISHYIRIRSTNFPNLNPPNRKDDEVDIVIKPTASDRDGDGIPNNQDACPDEIGPETNSPFDNGCPKEPK